MRRFQASGTKREPRRSLADQSWHRAATRWRLMAYTAAVLPLLAIIVLARAYPELNRQEISDWKPIISLAEESWKRGDSYQSRHLYLQTARIASWRQEWDGLVAAACGIHRLDGMDGAYPKALSILIQAMIAAEARQSRQGIATVAAALALIGADKAATAVLGRIQRLWPDETNDVNEEHFKACRARAPRRGGE